MFSEKVKTGELSQDLADKMVETADNSADVLDVCGRLSGVAVDHVSRLAATLAPVVLVETGISVPSSLAAFDLYGDASRGAELVARNRHRAPLLMPTVFEALAS
jgi:prophage DNA circulation protein